jgi:hypothetical protein
VGANSLLVNTERCFPILAPDSWILTAGRVEWWSGGSKRQHRKTTGLLDISYADFFCREDAEEESGLGGEPPFGEHREVFLILAPGSWLLTPDS